MKHLQSILLLILLALAGGHTVSFGQTALASAGGESGAQANASATISDAERQNQVQLNHAFAHEFVLTYDHIPDHLEYTNDNYNKPVAERTIDNEDITPLTWKWVKLEMPEPGGGVMTACLRRPEWWLTAHQADVPGNWVAISLPEMGIHGKAQVKELAPSYVDTRFADFQTDDGQKYRPITGWFERRAPEVWQYVFTSGDTIGATPNHPFYSEDRHTYLPADALHTGERVKLASRQTAALLSKWKLETSSEVVYNLEVWRDHNFYVGEHGVLVHNSCEALADFIALTKDQKLDFINSAWGARYPEIFNIRKFFQSLIGYYKFTPSKGWIETGEFFPTIDFHSVSQKMGVSIKTTKATDVQDFLNQPKVQDNIENLIIGRQAGQFVKPGQPALIVEKVQLSIIVPKENYSQAMVNQWKNAISAYIQEFYPGETLWVDIDFIEKHIN